jgi:hypothetical protein
MALSKQTLVLAKWMYWIILTCAHLYLCYILFVTNRAIAGILWLILGFIMIFIMYWVYFPIGNPGSQWPPYIAACPDYLTLLTPTACVDFSGLKASTRLKSSSRTNPPDPSWSDYSSYVFDPTKQSANMSLAQHAQQYNLTWEGIT